MEGVGDPGSKSQPKKKVKPLFAESDRVGTKRDASYYLSDPSFRGRTTDRVDGTSEMSRQREAARVSSEFRRQDDIDQIGRDTEEIKRVTRESRPFGSTPTAKRIREQKMSARRRGGRAVSRPRVIAATLG